MKAIAQYKRLLTAVVLLGTTGGVFAAPSGAIFTTDVDGHTVDMNIYSSKADVYLNGGPQNTKSAGLAPDGVYYFQVTDPSGATLLSTDNAVCRQLVIKNGVVKGAYTAGGCYHANGNYNSANGSTPVQLGNPSTNPPYFKDSGNPGGEYKAWLIAKTATTSIDPNDPKSLVFQMADTKTDNFKVPSTSSEPTDSTISGFKFYDVNLDGIMNNGELGIPLWKIGLFDGAISNTTTDSKGAYQFSVNAVTNPYGVCEVIPSSSPVWVPTTPTSIHPINAPASGQNFGNVCLGAGGGLTLGFWSNKNGQALVGTDDLTMLANLNLRNANGTNFPSDDPNVIPTYSAFRTWLLNATATNMAYMLSAQLSAMELNVFNGKVGGASNVYAGNPPANCTVSGLSATGFISIADLMSAANTSLGLYGYTVPSSDIRNCQEFMKNALDNANNDRNFVQATACAVNYSGTEASCP